jgi:hypothetical protein
MIEFRRRNREFVFSGFIFGSSRLDADRNRIGAGAAKSKSVTQIRVCHCPSARIADIHMPPSNQREA